MPTVFMGILSTGMKKDTSQEACVTVLLFFFNFLLHQFKVSNPLF